MSRDIKYIGMDVHKEATVIAVLNGNGDLVMESIVETKASSLLQGAVKVGAGSAWLWAREDMASLVDVLFVDEAGQMSLANVLAVFQDSDRSRSGGDSTALLLSPGTMPDCGDSRCREWV